MQERKIVISRKQYDLVKQNIETGEMKVRAFCKKYKVGRDMYQRIKEGWKYSPTYVIKNAGKRITLEKAENIRELIASGLSDRAIRRLTKVCTHTIRRIRKGVWKPSYIKNKRKPYVYLGIEYKKCKGCNNDTKFGGYNTTRPEHKFYQVSMSYCLECIVSKGLLNEDDYPTTRRITSENVDYCETSG
jgi:hypothetical protein